MMGTGKRYEKDPVVILEGWSGKVAIMGQKGGRKVAVMGQLYKGNRKLTWS